MSDPKKIFYTILLLCSHIHTIDFWISHHIKPLSYDEQELMLTTLDAAIKRIQAMLKTQDLAATLVEFVQEETDFISETRLQPAKCTDAKITHSEIAKNWALQKELYINTCLYYDHTVSLVDSDSRLLEAFNYVRHEARAAVLKATAYESYRLKDCLTSLADYSQKAFNSVQLLQSLMGKRSMVDNITQWFASLLVMPFKQCNDQLTIINNQSWELMIKQQALSNSIWRVIEEARLDIYKHYYEALTKQLKKYPKDTMHEN